MALRPPRRRIVSEPVWRCNLGFAPPSRRFHLLTAHTRSLAGHLINRFGCRYRNLRRKRRVLSFCFGVWPSSPVDNYGVIGNMKSIALVGMNASIDFLSYPDFDSPTVFAALLDEKQGSRFQIEPQPTDMRIRQLYLPDTNILFTRFLAEEGVAELTDFKPIEKDTGQPNEIVRIRRSSRTLFRGTWFQ